MDLPAVTTLTPEIAAEVGERADAAAVVESSIASLGSQYLLRVRARDPRTGTILHNEQSSAARKEDVVKAFRLLARRFVARLAGSMPRATKEPSLPVAATTPSLEAWRSYSAAMKASQSRAQSPESASLLKRAIEIDPTFAMAHAVLGRQQSDLGETESGAQSIARAFELRERVSDRENYYITFSYHRQVTRNLELARQTLESWTHKYPADFYPHGFLSGFVSPGLGHYDRAVEEGLKAIDLDPDFAIGYQNVAWVYVYLNRLEDAEALLGKAAERKMEIFQFSLVRYAIAFLRSDSAGMERESRQRQARLHAQGWFEHQEALTAACQGRLTEAARLSEHAVHLARQGGLLERAALFQGARAVWSALFEMQPDAQRNAAVALTLKRSRDADYGPAFAFALAGESAPAREIEEHLAARYPEDTSVQFSYLPTLRAIRALNDGDPARALDIISRGAHYDLALPATAYFTGPFFGAQYPIYVRGLAHVRLGRPVEAAAEFQRILDHPGLVINDPIGPATRLQLARALSSSGDRAGSVAMYQELLALWTPADPDVSLVRQARTECADLV